MKTKQIITIVVYILAYILAFYAKWYIGLACVIVDMSFSEKGKKAYKWLLTKKKQPIPPKEEPYELWNSIVNMPLVLWERFLYKKDGKALVISGNPSDEIIANTGNILFSEYCALIDDHKVKKLIKHRSKIYMLTLKYSVCMNLVEILSQVGDSDTVESLKAQGFNYEFNLNDKEAFFKDLDKVKAVLNGDMSTIQQLQKEIEDMQKQSAEGEKEGSSFFDTTLSIISKYRKYHIPKSGMMVGEFCALVRQFKIDIRNEQVKNNS